MRVAVISDIHGNSHALGAVLQAIEGEDVEEIWCLGDLVGYGPRPNECCRAIEERIDLCLAGNHDLGVLGRLDLEDFAPEAACSARWTRSVLEPQARAYLESLAPSAAREDVELFHGSPGDPVWEYVLSGEAALDALQATSAPLVLVGHSHVPLAIALGEERLSGGLAPEGSRREWGSHYLIGFRRGVWRNYFLGAPTQPWEEQVHRGLPRGKFCGARAKWKWLESPAGASWPTWGMGQRPRRG